MYSIQILHIMLNTAEISNSLLTTVNLMLNFNQFKKIVILFSQNNFIIFYDF